MNDIEDTAPSPQAGSDPTDPRIGSVVGKCVIVRLMGKGGMGAVYEARHAQLSRRFAIKFLLPEFATHKEVLGRFESEAKAAGGLEHPNLVAVTDVGRTTDGAPYLVMEFLQGEDCSQLLRRLGPLPVMRAADLVLQACRGLALAHKAGIVHRDLKPENLFVTDAGDGSDRVKVLDFGIAQIRSPDRSRVTRTGATLGTAHYMSPEQARADIDLDARTDVWSLGVVLYELLSGRRPFEGERFLQVIHQILGAVPAPLGTVRAGLPPGLVALVERAMAKNVTERLPTVAALADALMPFAGRTSLPPGHEALGHEPTMATPVTAADAFPSIAARTGMTAAKSNASTPGASGRSTGLRWVAVGVVAAAAAAMAVLAPGLSARLHATAGAGSVQAPPAPEAPPATQVRVPAADTPAASARAEPSPAPESADAGVRAASEPPEASSNKARGPGGVAPGARVTPRSPPSPIARSEVSAALQVSVPSPVAPSTESTRASDGPEPAATHHTKIDRANPY
jgi:tRNA A-37 threonylcarbamoyl transferase component Bud32